MAGKCDSTDEFIKQYKIEECLWNNKQESYKDRFQKQESMKLMGEKFGMTESEVRGKINSLRTYYTRELSKEVNSIVGTEQKHESKWPHFKTLSFLKETVLARKCSTTLGRIYDDLGSGALAVFNTDSLERNSDDDMTLEQPCLLPTMCPITTTTTTNCQSLSMQSYSAGSKRKFEDNTTNYEEQPHQTNVINVNSIRSHARKEKRYEGNSIDNVGQNDYVAIDKEPGEQVCSNRNNGMCPSLNSRSSSENRYPPENRTLSENRRLSNQFPMDESYSRSGCLITEANSDGGPCELFGQQVANGLRNVPSEMSRQWAMLKIQEILFQAQFSRDFVPSQYNKLYSSENAINQYENGENSRSGLD